jgi:hypothetical protein
MTPDELNALVADKCAYASGDAEAYKRCRDGIIQDNPVTNTYGASEAVPWQTVDTSQFGVSVPTKSGTVYRPQQTGTITSQAQVDYVRDNNSSFNNYMGVEKSMVPEFYSLPVSEQQMFDAAAKSIHPLKTGGSYYKELTDTSYDLSKTGINRSPQMLAYEQLTGAGAGAGGSGGSGGGGGGGSAGPTKSINRMTEPDIREMADNMAMQFIGRTLDDKEFNKIVKGQRKAENKNPTVSSVQGDTRVTEGGLTQQGREDLVEKRLMKSPEYRDFQFSTTAMDAVLGVIQEDMKISGQ